EEFWRDRQQFLQQRGYLLRPRFRPDWKPSWKGTWDCRSSLIGAVRIADDVKVMLKLVETSREEIPVARYLSSASLRSDIHNRMVPIFDIIPLPDTDDKALLVMPLLRHFEGPPFSYLCEVVEAVRQLLQ
ncbi:hypothetical protein M422DRAFT_120812, partial [Sphaerobolus stellatus SS14]